MHSKDGVLNEAFIVTYARRDGGKPPLVKALWDKLFFTELDAANFMYDLAERDRPCSLQVRRVLVSVENVVCSFSSE